MAAPTHAGEILQAGNHLCWVKYRLQTLDNPAGHIEITGQIQVDESERATPTVLNALGSGDVFTLKLEDGTSLDAWYQQIDPLSGVWRFVLAPGNAPLT